MSAAQVCRLCLSAENLVWVFDKRFDRPDHMRDVIFITTGVEIHYKDIVSQKICTKCGQDALKMFQFRQEAIKNDTYLKAQCRHLMNDTHHKIPNTSGTIKSEETSNNEEPPPINGIHASVISLSRQYPTLHLPSLCLSDDVQPFVSLEMDAVENYLKNRKQLTLKSPEISSKVPPINIRRNLTKSGGYAIVRHSIAKENSSNTTQSAMTQPINNKRKRTHDYREKKVHKHVKMSRRQRPLSCKARFRVAKLRKSHIHRSLLIRKALKKQPIVAVERIDTNFEVRRQYPHCFEDLLTIGCAEVIEILSDDEEGPSVTAQASIATSVITPNLMIKNNCVLGQLNVEEGSELDIVKEPHCCVMRGAEVIEIPSDDEVVTTTAPSVIAQARQRTFISTSVVKPAVTIKNSRILDRLNLKAGSELDIIKDVLVKCAKLDVASQTEEPSTTETATASQPSRTKQMQLWGDLKPIDVITHSNRQTAESDSNCSNELAMDITRATAVNPSNNDQQMAETASTSTSSQSVDVASATSLISNASYAVRALSQTESIPATSPLAASTPSLLEILLNNDIKTSGIRNAGLPETSRTQQVCANANVETIPREKMTLLSNNVKTSGIRNAGLSETSRTQQVCANANVETIPREKITLLSNNVKTSGIRTAGLPETSRTQQVCANANVETIPREKITLLSNNVKTSGIRNAGLPETSRTQQVCVNANVETIPREKITLLSNNVKTSGIRNAGLSETSRTQQVCANANVETIPREKITLLSNNVKTSGIRNAGLPETSRTQQVCANANVETIPREKITLLSNNVKTSGIRNTGLPETSRTQQVCANANVETIPREKITLLSNNIKTSGIRNAGLPETSRTQQVCANANVETIPREKIALLSNNVKTSGIRNTGLPETSRTQQVCANANVETIPREKITLLNNNVKTSGIRNAGLPEISRTQHVCANANVETIPREKITLLSNNVKTSGIRNAGLHDTSRTQQVCAYANVETIPRETITCEVVTDVFSEKQHEAARFGPGFSDSGSKHSRIKAAKASRTQRVCANDNLETITGEEIICGAVDNIFGKKQRESPRFGPGVSDSRSKQSRFNWYVDNSTTDSSNLRVNATFMPPVQLVVRDHQSSSTFSGQITRPSMCPSTSNVVFNTQSKLQRYSTRFPAAPAEKAAVGAPSDHFPSYNSRLLFNRLDLFNQYSCDSNGGVSVGSVSHLQMNGFSGADELTAQNAEAGKRFAMPNRIRVKNMCELR